MPGCARKLIAHSRRCGGFTFPELTVGFAVALIIAVAAMTFILISARQWQTQEERVSTTDDARNALHSMIAELRDASAVTFVDAQTIDATVRTAGGGTENVSYRCAAGTPTGSCSRVSLDSGASRLLVEGLVNADNFSVVAASDVDGASVAKTIGVRLALDLERAENPIVLATSVTPRNCSDAVGVINPC